MNYNIGQVCDMYRIVDLLLNTCVGSYTVNIFMGVKLIDANVCKQLIQKRCGQYITLLIALLQYSYY